MKAELKPVLRQLLPSKPIDAPDTPRRKVLRWAKTGVWILAVVVTLQSLLLVAGAWRNDRQIEANMGWRRPRCSAPARAGPPSNS